MSSAGRDQGPGDRCLDSEADSGLSQQDKDRLKGSIEDHEEEEEPVEKFQLLPPLLHAKFGNGLLLQYCLNQPDVDDKWNLLEVGLAIGISCLVIRVLSTALTYILKTFGSIANYKKERVKKAKLVARYANNFLALLQALLLVCTCLYCIAIYREVDHDNKESDKYVKKRVYLFTLIITTILTACVVEAAICWTLTLRSDQLASPRAIQPDLPHPATSLINLGLANAFLGIYIGTPEEMVGSKVFLVELCLVSACITIFMSTTETILKISLRFAHINGYLDRREVFLLRFLHFVRYSMAVAQAVVFSVMFCSSIYILSVEDQSSPEYKVPRNILILTSIVSHLIVAAALYGVIAILVLVKF